MNLDPVSWNFCHTNEEFSKTSVFIPVATKNQHRSSMPDRGRLYKALLWLYWQETTCKASFNFLFHKYPLTHLSFPANIPSLPGQWSFNVERKWSRWKRQHRKVSPRVAKFRTHNLHYWCPTCSGWGRWIPTNPYHWSLRHRQIPR